MNSYEKKKAQIEQKKLCKQYEIWVYPQSDMGVIVLTEAGFFTNYNLYYLDEDETEQQRLANAKDVAMQAMAYKFSRFSHRNVMTKEYRFALNSKVPGYERDLAEGIDYAIQITEIPVEQTSELTFDDIKAL
ncbi:hypothetical protein [Planococcus sp. ISL-110]|uniref:hypothetical protein n=1 Tax=Planococcus sp. ISL-110 TaxID=2819167 RepID=UPI001BE7443E|nr:hypothetical protein [Planococcus sp. ISL-110]MBT2569843.1 hypothetical protein [Planococcus sp. ISL-110]